MCIHGDADEPAIRHARDRVADLTSPARLLKRLIAALGTTVEEVWDSPYEALDEETHTGLAKRERNILREFLKLDRKSRLRIVEVQKQLNER